MTLDATRPRFVAAVFAFVAGLAMLIGAAFPAQAQYRLGTGDKVKVTVLGEEDLSGEFEVDGSGSLSLKAIGRVPVAGRSAAEVEQTITGLYRSSGFLRNPRVSIEISNTRPFFILGEVQKPGSYPFVNGLTVAQAVAIANGYTYRASTSRIKLKRQGSTEEIAATEDTPVMPGDIVRVPERFF